ncbi:type II secretion system F family protein [Pelomonas sp. Root1444]|uniref:type II secretion system F family protein n=1 Tax=Pelomonas sp. Root1444 TaxID=1736464 RepID=UPI000702A668|nr:type II secretion system F family protein [Pelomonas sp. Root1444]KQY88212.1 hypothetical protein ASD35_11465 [Pelomonas sp. Root1444]
MDFVARIFDPAVTGIREAHVRAKDDAEARTHLASEGLTVLALRPARGWRKRIGGGQRLDVALWCRELRALLQAGLSVVEALEALGAATGASSVYEELLARLREGKAFSSALADSGRFPALLIASVRASERTSDLAHALDAFLRFDELVGTLRRKVVSAAIYPALVIGLGLLIGVFLLFVVVPRLASLYAEASAGVSTATRLLISFSGLLTAHSEKVLGAAVSLALIVAWVSTGPRPRLFGTWLLQAWPWLGRQVGNFEKARLFEALALLVQGGYSLHEALNVCVGIAQSPLTEERLHVARQRIEHGSLASTAFMSAGLADPVAERLMRAGERGGDFDRVLRAIAERHRQTFETFVERATRLVEPVLLTGVALMVGGMVVLLYMPVFDIAASIR